MASLVIPATFPSCCPFSSKSFTNLSSKPRFSLLVILHSVSARVCKVSGKTYSRSQLTFLGEEEMSIALSNLEIEGVPFPATVVPPGSSKSLVLGGAGARGLEINGTFVKFTSIGIYVDEGDIKHLSPKLKGKTPEELSQDELLFEELLRAPHEKFVRVVFLIPLNGVQYSEKVLERVEVQGLYTNVQEKYRKQFLEVFKAENFPPRSSVLLSVSQEGLKVAFTKDNDLPKEPVAVIEDATFGEAVLATIIWKEGVSPAAKVSLAERLSKCF